MKHVYSDISDSVSWPLLTSHALAAALLTLADIVAAVRRLKRLSRVPGAAAKLHLWAVVSDPEHCGVSHVAATETVEGMQPSTNCHRMLSWDE